MVIYLLIPCISKKIVIPKGYLHTNYIVVTYEIRVFFEGAQKEVFSSILKFENVNM